MIALTSKENVVSGLGYSFWKVAMPMPSLAR